jgi:hypothetical protein
VAAMAPRPEVEWRTDRELVVRVSDPDGLVLQTILFSDVHISVEALHKKPVALPGCIECHLRIFGHPKLLSRQTMIRLANDIRAQPTREACEDEGCRSPARHLRGHFETDCVGLLQRVCLEI